MRKESIQYKRNDNTTITQVNHTNHRALKPFKKHIAGINRRRAELAGEPDERLKHLSAELKRRAGSGEPAESLLQEAFALACEASRRVLGLNPYDVQLAAAMVLHRGQLAEMQTGEGKTLAAVLPVYLNALYGKGVHVLTFNDYLAGRDARWMGPVYEFLGLTVGSVCEAKSTEERKAAYGKDVTYVTAREAGFDFLRDQRCSDAGELVHRPFHYVVVDEADSIMIDEARVPLVLAGDTEPVNYDPYRIAEIIRSFDEGPDYCRDKYSRDVNFTDTGLDRLEKIMDCGNLHSEENNRLLAALNLALQAEILLQRDIDYIIREGKVELVDEFTGRVADKRRWPYGLQTAVEAKEGLEIRPDGTILGSITLQHFLALYPKIAGMTATAKTSEDEMFTFYRLGVVVIPPNRSCIREDREDLVFTHKEAKARALLGEIARIHGTGRPILVGTASVEESEQLAELLRERRIPCNVLNAKNDALEASIVAEAGALRAVTISTNMAGRGTDIRLGGKDEKDREYVVRLGGLCVIGTNRHESRRIDNQLRGRAGRQGDPGSSRFFISMEDDLMVRYRLDELIPEKHKQGKLEEAIDEPVVIREIARAQRIVEGQNFEIRKTLRGYSYIIEEQRRIFQGLRRDVLEGREVMEVFRERLPERYGKYMVMVGSDVLEDVERVVTLYHMDKAWVEHLAFVAHLKEGVHLIGFGGRIPWNEFSKEVIREYSKMMERIKGEIIETLGRVKITSEGIDVEAEGLSGPTSTWTYLINDIPFNNPLKMALVGSNSFAAYGGLVIALHAPLMGLFLIFRAVHRLFKRKAKK